MRTFLGAAAVLAFAVAVSAGPQPGEKKVTLDNVPKAVMDTVKARFPEAKLIGASSEKTGDKTVYEVELEFKGLHHDVTLEPNGKMLLIEREIAFKNLPKPVQQTLAKMYPKVTYNLIEEVIKVENGKETLEYYEAHMKTADKKDLEAEILPDGKIKPAAKTDEKKGSASSAGQLTRAVLLSCVSASAGGVLTSHRP